MVKVEGLHFFGQRAHFVLSQVGAATGRGQYMVLRYV